MFTPIILAGGKGKRLYPISTNKEPKQFRKIFSEYSLLQNTILRVKNSLFDTPIILSNKEYLKILEKQIGELKYKCKLILEENQLGTSLIIAISLFHIPKEKYIAIFPSDHYIEDTNQFEQIIKNIIDIKDKIIILSSTVKYNSSDYGYLTTEKNSSFLTKIIKFEEKPKRINLDDNHDSFWNTGIIFTTVETMLNEFYKFSPEIMEIASNCFKQTVFNDINVQYLPNLYEYSSCSIDKVILENSNNIYTIYLQTNWYDFGNLSSIFDYIKEKYAANIFLCNTINREWGNYRILFKDTNFCVKHLIIFPKSSLSLQYHKHRDECLQVIKGEINILLDGRKKQLNKNNILIIEKFIHHQISNQTSDIAEILEIQHGDIIDENDIIRLK